MPRILKNIRIDEVSACTKGAGEGTRVVLMKRDDSADDDVYNSQWYKEQAAEAERQNEELRKHARPWRLFNEVLAENVAKSYAATARGDEADQHDEAVPVDEMTDGAPPPDGAFDGVPRKHRPVTFDTVDGTRMKFPNERALAEWLAIQPRIRKSTEDTPTMTTHEEKLSDLVKRAGITAIAAEIVKSNSDFSIDEHQLTALTIEHAKRAHPQLTDAQAFAAVFTAQDEGGIMLRKAFAVVRSAGSTAYPYPFPKL